MKYERNFYEIRPNSSIFAELMDERESIGYYNLPYKDISDILTHSKAVQKSNIVIIGIGGSTLGSKAIYSFLKNTKKLKNLVFLDTVDPLEINSVVSSIELKSSHFVVISKSGDTLEPISIFKYLSSLINIDSHNCTIISGKNTPLGDFARKKKIQTFFIDENIGGRFSVFSYVGLVPLCMAGVDVKELLSGCREVSDSFFNKQYYYDHIINKARFLVENKNRFVNNVIFSYSSVLNDFNKWYVQLWAESLGKINFNGTRQGFTPISLIGPQDQHSFLQLIMDGVRNKTVTFFKIDNLLSSISIPEIREFSVFNQEFVDDLSFNELINLQADSTYQAIIKQKDIPCDIITIDKINEFNIAKLMFRFQLLVSCVGSFLQINTYDQPGVEIGKQILKDRLSIHNEY